MKMYFLRRWFRSVRNRINHFNPWYLRGDISTLQKMCISRDEEIADLHEALANARQDIRNQEREIGRLAGRSCDESAALRKEIASLTEQIVLRDAEILRYLRHPDEQTARAMLMQLRVHQESVRHRTGYMVSAFVPQGVVEKLIERGPYVRNQYVALVAEVLVNNALSGIYKRSSATGKLTALVFSPVTARGRNVELIGGIYETNEKPVFVGMRPGDAQKLLQ